MQSKMSEIGYLNLQTVLVFSLMALNGLAISGGTFFAAFLFFIYTG